MGLGLNFTYEFEVCFIPKFFIAPRLIENSAKIDPYPSDTLFAPRTLKFLPTFLSRRPSDRYEIIEGGEGQYPVCLTAYA